jgi:hypothetical protein
LSEAHSEIEVRQFWDARLQLPSRQLPFQLGTAI